MTSQPPPIAPGPPAGRVYQTRRIVRSTDVTPSGRLRLDSVARYLQAAAEEDLADSGLADPVWWLVRRCQLIIAGMPAAGDRLAVRTWCSGTGPGWAERTTTLASPSGAAVEARAVWAVVDRAAGRPARLPADFRAVYGPSAAGRTVPARLSHPRPDGAGGGRAWPLRAADFDVAGHVNNAVHWAAVEDVVAEAGWLPAVAEVEYRRPVLPGCAPVLVTGHDEARAAAWLLDGEAVLASARLDRHAPEAAR